MSSWHVFHSRVAKPLANTMQSLEMCGLPVPFTLGTQGPRQYDMVVRVVDQKLKDLVPFHFLTIGKVEETFNHVEFQYPSL